MHIRLKRLFMIDGFGALLTAFMVGIVLPSFTNLFGMPTNILERLALVALLMSCYSFCCHWRNTTRWYFLAGIALANGFYSLTTIALVLWYRHQITMLGIAYFLVESVIVAGLAAFEWKEVSRLRTDTQ